MAETADPDGVAWTIRRLPGGTVVESSAAF
jgi:hypothetical protein